MVTKGIIKMLLLFSEVLSSFYLPAFVMLGPSVLFKILCIFIFFKNTFIYLFICVCKEGDIAFV